jgi:ribA/ribD-fused uncharacterized protein
MVIDSFTGQYRFLSNFADSPVKCYNRIVPTVEHAYQAYKADNPRDCDLICGARSPGVAKKLGRQISIRSDWDSVKDNMMLLLLREKFENIELGLKLLDTEDALLIEGNAWGDRYWGKCNGTGLNKLGILLMQVRSEMRNE